MTCLFRKQRFGIVCATLTKKGNPPITGPPTKLPKPLADKLMSVPNPAAPVDTSVTKKKTICFCPVLYPSVFTFQNLL